jgi:hypothetical protein
MIQGVEHSNLKIPNVGLENTKKELKHTKSRNKASFSRISEGAM